MDTPSILAMQPILRFSFEIHWEVCSKVWRQLRKDHPDGRYVNVLQQYAKDFAVKYKSIVRMISVDDKAIIPIGEPGLPVSTGVRGHNRSVVSAGHELAALDHDFHVSGLVPSVA